MSDPDDEFARIARYFAPLASSEAGAFDLLDDAAAFAPRPGHDIVVTTDALVGGVHFLADDLAADIARKSLRVNLSDLAAMGAVGRFYTLAAALPASTTDSWLSDFVTGLREDQEAYGVTLIGGDTVSTAGPITISVTALGECAAGKTVRRAGAKPGDRIYVSGTVGDAALGLKVRNGTLSADDKTAAMLIDRYLRPRPRTTLGPRLVGIASAMIDVSDGLLADLGHIASVSGVGAAVTAKDLPLSEAARPLVDDNADLIVTVLTGGDDYELLFTVPPTRAIEIEQVARLTAIPLTLIGSVESDGGVRALDRNGTPMTIGEMGYRHF
jgi:thiamine-monophosphate kinase